jgi:hypothetical protein
MNHPPDPRLAQPGVDEKPLPVIWAAFLAATVVYGGLGWLLDESRGAPVNLEILHWVQIFLGMGSGLIILTTFLLRQALAGLSRGSYRIYCIVRWALLESIAVFGLVQFFLGGHVEVLLLFVAVSALGLGAARPGPSDRAAWLHQFS